MNNQELTKLQTLAKELCLGLLDHPIISNILENLKYNLPSDLCYHNLPHTMEVMEDAILFALHDNLTEREIELIAIAAAYHDAGFIFQREDNEVIASKMASDALIQSGNYTEDEIKLIGEMIEDTKILIVNHQFTRLASNELSKYLLDADLANLGSPDFFVKNKLIHQETGMEESKFRHFTLALLKNHRWLTPAGMALKEVQRLRNLEQLTAGNNS